MKLYLATFDTRRLNSFYHGLVEISEDGILEDGTPIEDFGAYMTRDEPFPDTSKEFLDEQFMQLAYADALR